MTTKAKDPVLVVVQLTGGLDFMNTLIPYQDGRLYDWRPTVSVPAETTIKIDDQLAWHPSARGLSDYMMLGMSQSFKESDMKMRVARISEPWISCIPVSLRRLLQRAGWVR